MLISTLLVSNNNQKDLELLLPSLELALKNLHLQLNEIYIEKYLSEILLVDNCSSDLTVEFVEKNFPDVVITKNRKKMGYGANQNQNIVKAEGKFILLINPDMVVPPDMFNIMIRFMEQNHYAGIATCKVCNIDGSCQYLNKREPAILDLFIRRFFSPRLIPVLPNKIESIVKTRLDLYEMRDTGYDKIMDVPFISGSFMFARASVIKQLNGFDERFFMYFEDVDLCRRVRAIARSIYCPDVSVVHRWERASHKSLKWTFIFALSGLKYFHKWGFRFT